MEGGTSTGGLWTQKEKNSYHINELELMAAEMAIKTFTRERKPLSIHIFIDNTTALSYLVKMGGTKSQTLLTIAKRIWKYAIKRGITITASWIPSALNTTADWRSRQKPNSTEWELSNQFFLRIINQLENPDIDCFASRTMKKLNNYMSLNPDPYCYGTNALYQNWRGVVSLPFPALLHNRESAEKDEVTVYRESNTSCTTLARPTMVSNAVENDCSKPPVTSEYTMSVEKLRWSTTSPNSVRKPKTGGIPYLEQQLKTKGISGEATKIMLHSKRESTTKTYAPCWEKWVLWCSGKTVDPIDTPITLILDFLTNLYHEGLQYRTINVYRSAISACHKKLEGNPVGQHPDICSLMSGIDNLRPPKLRYNSIWEVDNVLTYLRNLGESLTDKQITLKTVMLLALAAAK